MDFALEPRDLELKERVARFARTVLQPIAPEADESHEVRRDVAQALAKEGIFRYVVPLEYGGAGIRVIALCIIREELSKVCDHADLLFAMQGLGSFPIASAGSPDLRRQYLPRAATGEVLATFALTEPEGGSDVLDMRTVAALENGTWTVTGSKRYVSEAAEADFFSLFVKTDPDKGSRSLTAFVLDRTMPGIRATPIRLGAVHPIGQLDFRGCRVPDGRRIGERGQGLRVALGTLDTFRTTVAAHVAGMAQTALDLALAYARQRHTFGKPLAEHQAIQFKLADMACDVDVARLVTYRAAWLKDSGASSVVKESSIAKLIATEAAQRVVDEALQIHGARGLEQGSAIERLYRSVRAPRIYEGTSEIQRLTIARQILRESAP
ncbi:MAG: acyl-CoA dehydrogenase family protein [Chloroflexi bacterium]|nr:acyl-CoA dehydrogenase family protein [Chloroflexota bacterium]